MEFNYEYQMAEPAGRWLASQSLTIKKEFSIPWGICDFVACEFDKERVQQRVHLGQKRPIGSQLRVLILSKIPEQADNKGISSESVLEKFSDFLSEEKIHKELKRLIKDKFIIKTESGKLQKLNGWIPLHKRLVALELKLDRINDVLHQAICNTEFANESYVGFPIDKAQHVVTTRKFNSFKSQGIGIVGIGIDYCKVFLKSDNSKYRCNTILQTHCIESFWRTSVKGI